MSVNTLETLAHGHGILNAIGRTPLVEVKNMYGESHFRVFVKLEGLNPGGSMKDRPAKGIIEHGLRPVMPSC